MAALAVLATVGSCQKEPVQPEVEQTPVVELEYQDVTFNVTAPSGPQTKTTYGETVTFETALEVEVYVGEGNAYGAEGQWLPEVKKSINKISDTEWEVTISLVKNYHYDIVFWAQRAENAPYTLDWESGKITADYTVAANDVTRDAFYHLCENYNYLTDGAGQSSYKIQLKRPFAQINLGASDYAALLELYEFVGKTNSDLATTITTATAEVPSILNVLDGTADTGAEVKFALAATTADGSYDLTAEKNNINVNEKSYTLVGSNYIFANTNRPDNPIVEMTLKFSYNNQSFDINVPNVPYARNYQTNILGNFFTSEAKFDVVIVPEFEKEDEYVHVWDGYTTSAPAVVDGEYIITTGAELAWVAEQVNSGENDFAGKTIKVVEEIRLSGYPWTPIGTSQNPFKGTFVGAVPATKSAAAPATIAGLYVNETEGPAGLVGVLKGGEVINLSLVEPNVNGESFVGAVVGKIFPDGLVEGVTVTGGQVNGNHFVGGIVAHAYGSVKNCVIDGTVVTGTPVKDNEDLDGDKVGGVIGYHAPDADGTEVSGNVVKNVTVSAKRDAGAVAGAANADNVKGNIVEKATIGSTEAPIAKNAGIIVGRVLAGTLNPKDNTYNHENIYVNGEQAKPAEYKFEVTYDAEATDLPVEGGSVTVKVAGNVAWTVAVPEGVTASSAEGEGDAELTFTVGVNEKTEVASYTIVIATEEEACEVKSYEIVVNQAAAKPEFVKATVAEFLAAAEDETVYELTGVITSVANTTYGNFYLKDATGEVYIYGLCSPEGAQKYWAQSSAKVGDTITVRTVRTSYNGTTQGKNAIFVALVPFVAQASEWGVVGDLNEWGKTPDVVMYNTWHTENLYVAYNVEIASGAFKIRANNNWDDTKNYGLETAGNIYGDKYYSLVLGSGSQNATPMVYGTYDVYFDLTNSRVALMTPGKAYSEAVDGGKPVTVIAGLKDHKWGVAGSFQGWDPANAVEAVVEGDWAVAKNVTLNSGAEFKFVADNAWTLSYGAACDVNVGTTYTTYDNGGNMKFVGEAGAYNLYFSLLDATFYMEEYVEAPTQFVKVTSLSDITADASYLLVYEIKGTTGKVFTGVDNATGSYKTVTIENSTIQYDETLDVVNISQTGDGYAFKIGGKYISGKSGSNTIVFNDKEVATTVKFETDGKISIYSNSTYFVFNSATSNGDRFRFYKETTVNGNTSTYVKPALYKLQ